MGSSPSTIRKKHRRASSEGSISPRLVNIRNAETMEGSPSPRPSRKSEIVSTSPDAKKKAASSKSPKKRLIDDDFLGEGSVTMAITTKDKDRYNEILMRKAHVPFHIPTQDILLLQTCITKYDHIIYVLEFDDGKPVNDLGENFKRGTKRTSLIIITNGAIPDKIADPYRQMFDRVKIFVYLPLIYA